MALEEFLIAQNDVIVDGDGDNEDQCDDQEPREPRLGDADEEPNDDRQARCAERSEDVELEGHRKPDLRHDVVDAESEVIRGARLVICHRVDSAVRDSGGCTRFVTQHLIGKH